MKTDDQYTWEDKDYIYPLTIIKDRYNGVYSGGAYTAWNLDPDDVPRLVHGDDMTCMDFWSAHSKNNKCWDGSTIIVGKGATIEEAVADLREKLFHNNL